MHSLENIPCNMSNLNIWDSLEFLHRNSIKNSIHGFTIKSGCLFLGRWPLTNKSSQFLSSVFNGVSHSLINRFQEGFHPYFPMGILVPIKVRWDHKRVIVFHDNKGQGSTLRSRDLNTRVNLLWYHLYFFRSLNISCWPNIKPSWLTSSLIRSRLNQHM